MVLLAWLPEREALEISAMSAARFGFKPVLGPDELVAELHRVREAGYAMSVGARNPEVSAIAGPIMDVNGNVAAAVSLVIPTVRMGDERQREFIPMVIETTKLASESLGYRPTT